MTYSFPVVPRYAEVDQQGVVEGPHVEAVAQCGLSARADVPQSYLADLVGRRLARTADVAIDLQVDVPLAEQGVLAEVVGGLFAAAQHLHAVLVDVQRPLVAHVVETPLEIVDHGCVWGSE